MEFLMDEENRDVWAETVKNYTDYDRVKDLYNQLKVNVDDLDRIVERIKVGESENAHPNELEYLYQNEFMLLVENIGIYEDIMIYLDRVERTAENEFELAKIKRDVSDMVVVDVIEL